MEKRNLLAQHWFRTAANMFRPEGGCQKRHVVMLRSAWLMWCFLPTLELYALYNTLGSKQVNRFRGVRSCLDFRICATAEKGLDGTSVNIVDKGRVFAHLGPHRTQMAGRTTYMSTRSLSATTI